MASKHHKPEEIVAKLRQTRGPGWAGQDGGGGC
jgi:hypothetical protein